jgi:hypothetical protein
MKRSAPLASMKYNTEVWMMSAFGLGAWTSML